MAWVKIDDAFPDHPKVQAAGPRAAWLYVSVLCWPTRRPRAAGVGPTATIYTLASSPRSAARWKAKLIAVGLWEATDDGIRIHDYGEYQKAACAKLAQPASAKFAHTARPRV